MAATRYNAKWTVPTRKMTIHLWSLPYRPAAESAADPAGIDHIGRAGRQLEARFHIERVNPELLGKLRYHRVPGGDHDVMAATF
jgi:hypothetical protein